jgi:hypothetical protein
MNKTDKEHMRILFAGFALCGVIGSKSAWTPRQLWEIADEMIDSMEDEDEKVADGGIVSIVPKRKRRSSR